VPAYAGAEEIAYDIAFALIATTLIMCNWNVVDYLYSVKGVHTILAECRIDAL